MILEAICFFPIYFPIALLTALLSVRGKHHGLRILGRLLTGIVFTAIIAVGLSYLHKRGIWADASLLIQCLLCLFAGFLMESALYALLKRRSPSACRKLFWLGMLGCCYLLWELACVQGLKALAGRPRYETLLQGAGSFSPWYVFKPPRRLFHFPSRSYGSLLWHSAQPVVTRFFPFPPQTSAPHSNRQRMLYCNFRLFPHCHRQTFFKRRLLCRTSHAIRADITSAGIRTPAAPLFSAATALQLSFLSNTKKSVS